MGIPERTKISIRPLLSLHRVLDLAAFLGPCSFHQRTFHVDGSERWPRGRERERGIRDEKWTKRGGAWNGKWKKEGRRERRREKGRVGVHFSPIKYHAPDRIELVITQSGRWSLVTWRLQASALPFLTFLIFLLLCSRDFSPPEEKPNFGNYRISGIRYLEYIVYSMYYVSYLDRGRNESFSEFLCTDVTNRITCVRIEICSTSE